MKTRDKGVLVLAERWHVPAVEPIAQHAYHDHDSRFREPRPLRERVGHLDGEALQYASYLARRNDDHQAATFEDFVTILNMGREQQTA